MPLASQFVDASDRAVLSNFFTYEEISFDRCLVSAFQVALLENTILTRHLNFTQFRLHSFEIQDIKPHVAKRGSRPSQKWLKLFKFLQSSSIFHICLRLHYSSTYIGVSKPHMKTRSKSFKQRREYPRH